MHSFVSTDSTTLLREDVRRGLLSSPKTLPSKYFYGGAGDDLFARIMTLPEYYLTRCETEILQTYAPDILRDTGYGEAEFEILELGAGNGLKTRILLAACADTRRRFRYLPVDISSASLAQATANVRALVPTCTITPYTLDYTDTSALPETEQVRLWLFLGSNLGNYTWNESTCFLANLTHRMHPRDTLLLGLDLHKDSETILPAYNDSAGVTAEFNLNLLRRINRECETNFDLTQFVHAPLYNERLCRAESYLRSLSRQRVVSNSLGLDIMFGEKEGICTEISQKYTAQSIDRLLGKVGLRRVNTYYDTRRYYANVLCAKV